ncbi:MAG: heavy metal-binding protein [Gammaproteobacteria bacterium]|nr:heavy metal-binding protein [Gammaproteobacteria bacterium]
MTTTIELEIQGMTCEHCVKRATKALQSVPGATEVEVTLEPGAARISGANDSGELIKAVEAAGYKAALK